MKTPCECPVAGFCDRHKKEKGEVQHKLCQTNQKYFNLWDRLANGSEEEYPDCPHLTSERCGIASELAGKDISVILSTCRACVHSTRPMRLNNCTLTLAYQHNTSIDVAHLQRIIDGTSPGFGTRMANTFGLIVRETPGCGCEGHKDVIDSWTKEHVAANIDKIIDWLQVEARKRRIPFSRSLTRTLIKTLLLTYKD